MLLWQISRREITFANLGSVPSPLLIIPSNSHTVDRAVVLNHWRNAAQSYVTVETESFFFFCCKTHRFICTIMKQNTLVGLGGESNILPASIVLGLWVNRWLSIRVLKYLLTLIIVIRGRTEFYLEKSKKIQLCCSGESYKFFQARTFFLKKIQGNLQLMVSLRVK